MEGLLCTSLQLVLFVNFGILYYMENVQILAKGVK